MPAACLTSLTTVLCVFGIDNVFSLFAVYNSCPIPSVRVEADSIVTTRKHQKGRGRDHITSGDLGGSLADDVDVENLNNPGASSKLTPRHKCKAKGKSKGKSCNLHYLKRMSTKGIACSAQVMNSQISGYEGKNVLYQT
jgi:hypothetical protein